MSALGQKADVGPASWHACFVVVRCVPRRKATKAQVCSCFLNRLGGRPVHRRIARVSEL